MKTLQLTLGVGLLAAAVAVTANSGQQTTDTPMLPSAHLVDFAQTPATSLDQYFGQTVLLEFFAFW